MADYSYLYKFPGGTPTLDRRKLTEDSRQFDASLQETQEKRKAEALQAAADRREKQQQWNADYQLEKQRVDYETSKPYYSSSDSGSVRVNPASLGAADAIIQDMYNARTRRASAGDAANYNYYWHISKAQNQGWWNNLDRSDQERVIKAAQSLTGKD